MDSENPDEMKCLGRQQEVVQEQWRNGRGGGGGGGCPLFTWLAAAPRRHNGRRATPGPVSKAPPSPKLLLLKNSHKGGSF